MASGLDLSGFCGDPASPRIELNGMLAASPAVIGHALALNCCDAAELVVDSMQISTRIAVLWRHQVGQGPNPPITLDLANLPAGWGVSIMSGCDPTLPNCQPTDIMNSGITGTLTIDGTFAAYQMSACLQAADSAADPHPVIHSIQFWTPTVTAN
jgi:hypothetical protein